MAGREKTIYGIRHASASTYFYYHSQLVTFRCNEEEFDVTSVVREQIPGRAQVKGSSTSDKEGGEEEFTLTLYRVPAGTHVLQVLALSSEEGSYGSLGSDVTVIVRT
eukprot:gene705-785_t